MYKKYINKGGKRIGPYYYDSIRSPGGKVKTIYLGKDPQQALKKAASIKHQIKPAAIKKRSATPTKAINHVDFVVHQTLERSFLGLTLILLLLGFVYFGNIISFDETPSDFSLVTQGFDTGENALTGQFIFDQTPETSKKYTAVINTLIEDSTELPFTLIGIDTLKSISINGEVLGDLDTGTLKIFLESTDTKETYLLFSSDSLVTNEDQTIAAGSISGSFVDLPTDGNETDNQTNVTENDTSSIETMLLMNELSQAIDHHILVEDGLTTISFDNGSSFTINIMDFMGKPIIYSENTHAKGLIEPPNTSFVRAYGFDFQATDFSSATLNTKTNASYLYICKFWDALLKICLTDWDFLEDLNNTNNTSMEYTVPFEPGTIGIAEGIFSITLPEEETIVEIPPAKEEEPKISLLDTLYRDLYALADELNISNTSTPILDICGDTCSLHNTPKGDYNLKIYMNNLLFAIHSLNIEVQENVSNTEDYQLLLYDAEGTMLFNSSAPSVSSIDKLIGADNKEISHEGETVQYGAVIGKPVQWKRTIKLNSTETNLQIAIPAHAKNITVNKVVEGSNLEVTNAKVLGPENSFEKLNEEQIAGESNNKVSGSSITGMAIDDIIATTGDAEFSKDEAGHINETKTILVEDSVEELEIIYETPGPQVVEEQIPDGKRVTISSETHYENILSYTYIPEDVPVEDISFYRLIDGNRVPWSFDAFDTDNSGFIDYIEWVIPSLSNDTYDLIIEIIDAEHLDTRRNFISNIFNETKAQDNRWSEPIYHEEYVRVVFEKALDETRDITVYARNTEQTNTYIEVYTVGSNKLITTFPIITTTGYYKIFLTGMRGRHETFDLRMRNEQNSPEAYLEFDHIIDPQASPEDGVLLRAQTCNATQGGTSGFILPCNGTYPATCDAGDYIGCNDVFNETHLFNRTGHGGILANYSNDTITNCDEIGEVFLCYKWWVNSTSGIAACTIRVDADSGFSPTTVVSTCPSTIEDIAATCINVTDSENWVCDTFFGSSPSGALVNASVATSTSNFQGLLNIDVLMFNVTYENTVPPATAIVSPLNSSFTNQTQEINITATDENLGYVMANIDHNLLVYTRFESADGVGNTQDESGYGNTGRFFGTAVDINGTGCKFGNCSNYDDASSFVNFSNTTSVSHGLNSTEMAFSMWLNPRWVPTSVTQNRGIFAKSRNLNGGTRFLYAVNIDDFRWILVTEDDQITCETVDITWLVDTFHHLAGTYNGSQMRIYWDAENIQNCTATGRINYSDADLILGANFRGTLREFNGTIDEFMLFNRSLSEQEIQTLYNASEFPYYEEHFFENGSHEIEASAVDFYANINDSESVTFNIGIDGFIPNVTLNAPENDTNYSEVGTIILNGTVQDFDTEKGSNRTVTVSIWGSNGTKGAGTDMSDLIYYNNTLNHTDEVILNWTAPVIDKGWADTETLLLLHFDKREFFGENESAVVDFAGRQNGTIEDAGDGPNVTGNNMSVNATLGKIAGALQTKGPNCCGRVDFDDYDEITHGNSTFLLWVNPSDIGIGVRYIVAKADIPQSGQRHGLIFRQSTETFAVLFNISSAGDAGGNRSIPDFFTEADTWYHIAVVINLNGTLDIYKNGILNKSFYDVNITRSGQGNNDGFYIGNARDLVGAVEDTRFNQQFEGMIDEFVLINKTLNASEVLETYKLRSGTFYWNMSVVDHANNSNYTETRTFTIDRPPLAKLVGIQPRSPNITSLLNCTFTLQDDLQTVIQSVNVTFFNESEVYYETELTDVPVEMVLNASLPTTFIQRHFQNWSCGVIPRDNFSSDDQFNATTTETIIDFIPSTPALVNPNGSVLNISRTPTFTWTPGLPNNLPSISCVSNCGNTSDFDNDTVDYLLNLTCFNTGGGGCDNNFIITVRENVTFCDSGGNGIIDNGDNCSYTLQTTEELQFFYDNNDFYNWTVSATTTHNDSGKAEHNKYNLSVYVAMSVRSQYETTPFGDMFIGETATTVACNTFLLPSDPCPVVIDNIGNVLFNVNLTGPDKHFWETASYPHGIDVFSIRIGNDSETGQAYALPGSNNTFTALPDNGTNMTLAVDFNYSTDNNSIRVDTNITVPALETPGLKNMTLLFTGWYVAP